MYCHADLSSMMSFPVTCNNSLVAYDQSESTIRLAGEAERDESDIQTKPY